jgi:hypothetical protein
VNDYINDAAGFLTRGAQLIRADASSDDVVSGALFTAIGVEKLLKGILWQVNPAFVLKEQDFKHVAPTLYPDRLVASEKHDSEISTTPNRDVVSMRTSILRAKVLSEAISEHKGVLFALASHRDIIAHRPSSELDQEKVKATLIRDVYPMLAAVATELRVSLDSLIGGQSVRLAALSARHQTDVENRVRLTLEVHRSKWTQLMGVPGFVDKMKSRTAKALAQGNKRSVQCPACGNEALLSVDAEYEMVDGGPRVAGEIAKALFCYFCKLSIDDEIDLDHLNLL